MEWRTIPGHSQYEVSKYGVIRNTRGMIIKQQTTIKGYKTVRIVCDKTKKQRTNAVGRLVAKTFLKKPKGKNYVNHINEIKSDNRLKNLEWMTRKENVNHGTCQKRRIKYLKKDFRVRNPDGKIFKGSNLKEFCSKMGLEYTSMVRVTKGEYKQYKGWVI